MNSGNLLERANKVLAPVLDIETDIVAVKGDGLYIEDQDGKRYMDFSCGTAVTNIGHNPPRVVEAATAQLQRFIHSGCIFYYEPLIQLAEKLKEITPPGIDTFFFSNSGAEAVEGSIKLARYATRRHGIIAFRGAFHGRTTGALSLTTSNVKYRRRYAPLLPSIYHAPYPYPFRSGGLSAEQCADRCLDSLRAFFQHEVPPEEVAGLIIEPIQGEGGYLAPPATFLAGVQEICREHGIVFILDEVQSGFGRTCRWFAAEHFDLQPDVILMAKGIASGFPLSAIGGRREVMAEWTPGAHGTTFGGNPVSCAASLATIETIERDGLFEKAQGIAAHAMERLRNMASAQPGIGEVRGIGYMIGIELVEANNDPAPELLNQLKAFCQERGMVFISCGPNANVIRFAPPLCITQDEMTQGLDILEEGLSQLVSSR